MAENQSTSPNDARNRLVRLSNRFDRLLEIQHRGLDAYSAFATTMIRDLQNGELRPGKVISAWCHLSDAWIRNGSALLAVLFPSSPSVASTSPPAGAVRSAEKPSSGTPNPAGGADPSSGKR